MPLTLIDLRRVSICAGPKPMVIFNPPAGILKPRSQTAVKVSFTPPGEGVVEASATCAIKQQRNPLILHIHGEGLRTYSQLAIEQTDGNLVLLNPQTTKTLDFGQVYLLNPFETLVVTCRTQHTLHASLF